VLSEFHPNSTPTSARRLPKPQTQSPVPATKPAFPPNVDVSPEQLYCCRNAMTGSTFAALRAGTSAASVVTINSADITIA
jgi:hypothetical protein